MVGMKFLYFYFQNLFFDLLPFLIFFSFLRLSNKIWWKTRLVVRRDLFWILLKANIVEWHWFFYDSVGYSCELHKHCFYHCIQKEKKPWGNDVFVMLAVRCTVILVNSSLLQKIEVLIRQPNWTTQKNDVPKNGTKEDTTLLIFQRV